jgi:methionyl-tRNA formyltransferase
MKVSVLCSSKGHPAYPMLEVWRIQTAGRHAVELVDTSRELSGGDILFLIACHEIVGRDIREKYRACLVAHASDVPEGRGWSPHVWQILEGRETIKVTLMEAGDTVDSGAIWKQAELCFAGHELYDEINRALYNVVIGLMDFAIEAIDDISPVPQRAAEPTYYRKRTPEDSRVDPGRSIAGQFDLLRVADPDRYPAFFDFRGHRYEIRLIKSEIPDP